ncbi:M61 family metallopeptidase [Gangjinia marincola]
MKFSIVTFILLSISQILNAQVQNEYVVSFENAVHHEAQIKATFPNIQPGTFSVRMSRTSPGRYALHEFAKNVYDVKVTDGSGNELLYTRPNLHQWDITGHDGTVIVTYTLFGDRADGTYSQIDETHAHLNIPATFMYAPMLRERPVKVTFNNRQDLNWKIATQLIILGGDSFLAPNLDYFMDSPVELSNHTIRSFNVTSGNAEYEIKLALHHEGTEEEADQYIAQIEQVVLEQQKIFGDLPNFEYGEYVFLACYLPHVSGDGMEHRNSTVLTSTTALANDTTYRNLGTVSHEFFHAWNIERIRPGSLEPFDYEEANLSGELWFGEGFTSYYDDLVLCRAGIITPETFIQNLTRTYNYVWNSPALAYYNPIEMSKKAPFYDAATSIDAMNRTNTFVSYYSYGSMLALALDLSLRSDKDELTLDDYMKLLWTKYGKTNTFYTIENLYLTLREYAGETLADNFFENYIYDSKVPNLKKGLNSMAYFLKSNAKKAYMGLALKFNDQDMAVITDYVKKNSPAYKAGLTKGDVLLAIGNQTFSTQEQYEAVLAGLKPGKEVMVTYLRRGEEKKAEVRLAENPTKEIVPYTKPTEKALLNRAKWLNIVEAEETEVPQEEEKN